MFKGTSFYADSVDMAMLVIVGISVFFLLGIVAVMIYFVIRYSRKRNPVATQIDGNMALEAAWIIIPLILVLGMFWLGWKDFYKLREMSDYAMKVEVKGMMWRWEFTYPNGKVTDTLYVPVGKVTKLEMLSADVNHAFFIPAFRLKEDVIANRTTYMILTPEKIGNFDVACAEYCGLNHAYMYTMLKVVPEDYFEEWLNADSPSDNPSDSSEPAQAAVKPKSKEEFASMLTSHDKFNLLKKHACITCHTTDGSTTIGPSFAKLAEGKSVVITKGNERTVTINKDYLRTSVLEPDVDIVKGYKAYTMPSLRGRISEKDLEEIVSMLIGK